MAELQILTPQKTPCGVCALPLARSSADFDLININMHEVQRIYPVFPKSKKLGLHCFALKNILSLGPRATRIVGSAVAVVLLLGVGYACVTLDQNTGPLIMCAREIFFLPFCHLQLSLPSKLSTTNISVSGETIRGSIQSNTFLGLGLVIESTA